MVWSRTSSFGGSDRNLGVNFHTYHSGTKNAGVNK
jgi:hypothetical protein